MKNDSTWLFAFCIIVGVMKCTGYNSPTPAEKNDRKTSRMAVFPSFGSEDEAKISLADLKGYWRNTNGLKIKLDAEKGMVVFDGKKYHFGIIETGENYIVVAFNGNKKMTFSLENDDLLAIQDGTNAAQYSRLNAN